MKQNASNNVIKWGINSSPIRARFKLNHFMWALAVNLINIQSDRLYN